MPLWVVGAIENMFELYNSQQNRIVALACATIVFLCMFLYQLFGSLFIGWQFLGFAAKPDVTFQIICCILIAAGVVQLAAKSFFDHRELKYRSYHDERTGIPNERKLLEVLTKYTQSSDRETTMALLMIDIDELKEINVSIGYASGDELIAQLASNMRDIVYGNLQLFKLSGGQFGLLFPSVENTEHVNRVTDDIFKNVSSVFYADDREVYFNVSIGADYFDNILFKPQTVIRNADFALQQAKKNGGNRFVSYDAGAAKNLRDQSTLDSDLRKMIDNQEVELVYQPLINSKTGRMRGVEVLSRWNHPIHGYISPSRFVESAEQMGLLSKLGIQVMIEACIELKEFDDLMVAVNISPTHFLEPNFVDDVLEVLRATEFPENRLEIEITEAVLLENSELAVIRIREMRSLGISIALDDFGVGYSGLSYLNKFKVNRIKIDASFVRELETSATSRSIVSTMIHLGREQGFEVTIEGIETQGQVEFLSRFEDLCYQGFLFAKPMGLEDFARSEYLISHQNRGPLLESASEVSLLPSPTRDGSISYAATNQVPIEETPAILAA